MSELLQIAVLRTLHSNVLTEPVSGRTNAVMAWWIVLDRFTKTRLKIVLARRRNPHAFTGNWQAKPHLEGTGWNRMVLVSRPIYKNFRLCRGGSMIFEGGGNLGIWKMVGWGPALGPMLKKAYIVGQRGGADPGPPPASVPALIYRRWKHARLYMDIAA